MYYYNQRDYANINYDRPSTSVVETVATSGCGVCAVCIVLNNLMGKENFTVKDMAKFSLDNGARDSSGTNMVTLLNAVCKKYPDFSWKASNSKSELVSHIRKGGIAVINQGDAYNVFSDSGHFVVGVQMYGDDVVDAYDPYLYDGKYAIGSRPKRIVLATKYGARVKVSEIEKAAADRKPSYYLVDYAKKNTSQTTAPTFKAGKVYTLTTNVNVRTGAGVNNSRKKRSQLTADGQKNALAGEYAVLKNGTRFTVLEVKYVGSDIWVRIPSGWIAVYYNGDKYAK